MFDEYALKLIKQMIPGKEDWVYDKLIWEIPNYPFTDQHTVKECIEDYKRGFDKFGDAYTPWIRIMKKHLLLPREGQVVLSTNAPIEVISKIFDDEPPRTPKQMVDVLVSYGYNAYQDEVVHAWALR